MPSGGPPRVSRCAPTGWNANVVECSAPDESLNDCGVECNERGFGSRLKTLSATSAGGVVARKVDGKVQIALVGNSSRNTWYLPKGGLAKGETIEQAAVREVTEETGLRVRLVKPIRFIDYWFHIQGARVHKTVHYFLMEPTGEGDFSQRDWENDRAGWFDLEDALAVMTYENEKDVVKEAVEQL